MINEEQNGNDIIIRDDNVQLTRLSVRPRSALPYHHPQHLLSINQTLPPTTPARPAASLFVPAPPPASPSPSFNYLFY